MLNRGQSSRMMLVFVLVVVGACAQATRRARPFGGPGVMDRCQSSEILVVENKTSYPVRVTATDDGPNAFATGNQLLEIIPSGKVDTISRMATGHAKVQFDLDQPRMASGVQAPTSGFHAQCVAKA